MQQIPTWNSVAQNVKILLLSFLTNVRHMYLMLCRSLQCGIRQFLHRYCLFILYGIQRLVHGTVCGINYP